MDYILTHWQPLLLALFVGFIAGRMTAKDPIQRDKERREHEAAIRRYKAEIKPELLAEARALVRDNRKIEAIKLVREQMGIGLKEAKDLVDDLDGQPR